MFEIYLGSDGPVLIEDEQQICILHTLADSSRGFGQIVDDVGFPKDIVSLCLEQLADMGVIRSESSHDAEAVFSLATFPLIIASDKGVATKMARRPLGPGINGTDNLENWLIYYLFSSTIASGISIAPILCEDNYDLGYRIGVRSESEKGISELGPLMDFMNRCGFATVRQMSSDPLVVNIAPGKLCRLMFQTQHRDVLSSLFLGYLHQRTGCSHTYRLSEGETRWDQPFTVEFIRTGFKDKRSFRAFSRRDPRDPGFSLYWNGREYVPVTRFLQRSILRLLSTRSYSIPGLTEYYGIKNEAVSLEVKALEKAGLVKRIKHRKPPIYRISSVKAFDWTKGGEPLSDEEVAVLDRCIDNPVHFIRYWFHYFLLMSHKLGFDHDVLVRFLGNSIGVKLASESESTSVESILENILNTMGPNSDTEVRLVSRSPLTFEWMSENEMSAFIAGRYRIILDSLISSLLTQTSGIPFTVLDSQIGGAGNRVYTGLFTQTFKVQKQ